MIVGASQTCLVVTRDVPWCDAIEDPRRYRRLRAESCASCSLFLFLLCRFDPRTLGTEKPAGQVGPSKHASRRPSQWLQAIACIDGCGDNVAGWLVDWEADAVGSRTLRNCKADLCPRLDLVDHSTGSGSSPVQGDCSTPAGGPMDTMRPTVTSYSRLTPGNQCLGLKK